MHQAVLNGVETVLDLGGLRLLLSKLADLVCVMKENKFFLSNEYDVNSEIVKNNLKLSAHHSAGGGGSFQDRLICP